MNLKLAKVCKNKQKAQMRYKLKKWFKAIQIQTKIKYKL